MNILDFWVYKAEVSVFDQAAFVIGEKLPGAVAGKD